jgi:HSP20 family protein
MHSQCKRTPATDIYENKDAFTILLNLAGVEKEAVKITFNADILTVEAERKQVEEPDQAIHREIRYGKFSRSFKLAKDVDSSRFSAEFSNGVLKIVLPKTEAVAAKYININ